MGSLTHPSDPNSRHYCPSANEYRASKAALNMLMLRYSGKLGREGIKILGADPGFCATNFTGNLDSVRQMGATEPEVEGQSVAFVVKGDRDADVGKVCGLYRVSPW
jgi:NAD(P)-dependent dehydrogenase (short-subunit alcohol dehydrogenase family)